ncbi:hypothetical protein KCU69_g22074, partial [Aureobasidium melanogenum]
MHSTPLSSFILLASAVAPALASAANDTLVTDINFISQHWGQISTYMNNPADAFGVQWVGLPAGCQVEQAHTLQRHAQRFP